MEKILFEWPCYWYVNFYTKVGYLGSSSLVMVTGTVAHTAYMEILLCSEWNKKWSFMATSSILISNWSKKKVVSIKKVDLDGFWSYRTSHTVSFIYYSVFSVVLRCFSFNMAHGVVCSCNFQCKGDIWKVGIESAWLVCSAFTLLFLILQAFSNGWQKVIN